MSFTMGPEYYAGGPGDCINFYGTKSYKILVEQLPFSPSISVSVYYAQSGINENCCTHYLRSNSGYGLKIGTSVNGTTSQSLKVWAVGPDANLVNSNILAQVDLSGQVKDKTWYRINAELTISGDAFTITGSLWDMKSKQVGPTLNYSGNLSSHNIGNQFALGIAYDLGWVSCKASFAEYYYKPEMELITGGINIPLSDFQKNGTIYSTLLANILNGDYGQMQPFVQDPQEGYFTISINENLMNNCSYPKVHRGYPDEEYLPIVKTWDQDAKIFTTTIPDKTVNWKSVNANSPLTLGGFPAMGWAFSERSAWPREIKSGTAIQFVGTPSKVNCGNVGDPINKRFAVSCWYKTTSTAYVPLFGKEDGLHGDGYIMELVSFDNRYLCIEGTGTDKTIWVANGCNVRDGNWHHIVLTQDGDTSLRAYFDGVDLGSKNLSIIPDPDASFWIGRRHDGGIQANQTYVDEVVIWGRSLTSEEVKTLYNYGAGTYGDMSLPVFSGTVAGWHFDEGSGQTAADFSGNGHAATVDPGINWVRGYDFGNNLFDTVYPIGYDYGLGDGPTYARNIKEELSAAGEWHFDYANGTLSIVPLEGSSVSISATSQPLKTISGASNLVIENKIFELTRGCAVVISNSSNITFRKCIFRYVGGYAARISNSTNIRFEDCWVHDNGCGGFRFQNCGDRNQKISSGCVVKGCRFDRNDQQIRSNAYNVSIQGCYDVKVLGSTFTDVRGNMVIYADQSNDSLIRGNIFYNCCYEFLDAGAIYGGRDQTTTGIVVQDNTFWNIGRRNGWTSSDPSPAGVYWDDYGMPGCPIIGNLFVNCGTGVEWWFTNTQVTDNIFDDCLRGMWGGATGTIFSNNQYRNVASNIPQGGVPFTEDPDLPFYLTDEELKTLSEQYPNNLPKECTEKVDWLGRINAGTNWLI